MKRLLALTLALCLLLSGCLPYRIWRELLRRGGVLENAAMQAADACEEYGDIPRFSAMPYESPDEAALREIFETARAMAAEGADADALMDALDRGFEAYDDFYTLDSIAMIRSDADQTDAYWAGEYDRCERLIPQVEQWYNQMLAACAASPTRRAMERSGYFAPGELDYYEENDDYPDEWVALLERESELEAAFRALGEDFDMDGEQMHRRVQPGAGPREHRGDLRKAYEALGGPVRGGIRPGLHRLPEERERRGLPHLRRAHRRAARDRRRLRL